jgi:hypothetical protein
MDLVTITDDVQVACQAIVESRRNREAREERRSEEKASVKATAEARSEAAGGSGHPD